MPGSIAVELELELELEPPVSQRVRKYRMQKSIEAPKLEEMPKFPHGQYFANQEPL
jgi:hypothetical protein